jgi:hypothetical protein
MKKIYLSFTGLILFGSIIGQTSKPLNHPMKAVAAPNDKLPTKYSNDPTRAAGAFRLWVDPVGDAMNNLGVDITGTGTAAPSQEEVIDAVYQDSTVTISDPTNGTRFVSTILEGSILDPKSPNLQSSFDPIVTKYDAYSIDSVAIRGSYVKKTAATDTLYIWLVWGDSSNTNVFSKRLDNQTWNSPIGDWRHTVIGPKIAGASASQGNQVKAAAPSSNKYLYKYVLQPADSSASGFVHTIFIGLPSVVNVPAGNIVSCFYTFIPGGTHNLGDCSYSFSGAPATQNVNGFAATIWQQKVPAVAALTDYQPQQVDPNSLSMGISYNSFDRYNTPPYGHGGFAVGDLVSAPVVNYSIFGTNTTGVTELAKNGFALNQNTPNPFTNQTTIKYQLQNAASNVALEIYDIRGVKMFEKTQKDVREGKYSIEVNNTNFASGIYFYSLIVDGNKITKKMIVQ